MTLTVTFDLVTLILATGVSIVFHKHSFRLKLFLECLKKQTHLLFFNARVMPFFNLFINCIYRMKHGISLQQLHDNENVMADVVLKHANGVF